MIGGSPCQDLSTAGLQKGLAGERSRLFHEYVRLKNALKPQWFMLENVANIPKDTLEEMNRLMGCVPSKINSAYFSAQSRKRNYWTNIPKPALMPPASTLTLNDILEDSEWQSFNKKSKPVLTRPATHPADYFDFRKKQALFKSIKVGTADKIRGYDINKRVWSKSGKSPTIVASKGDHVQPKIAIHQLPRGNNTGGLKALNGKIPTITSSCWENNNHIVKNTVKLNDGSIWEWRKMTPIECERAQGMPDNYTNPPNLKKPISKTQRYKMIGNGYENKTMQFLLSELAMMMLKSSWLSNTHKRNIRTSL